MKPILKNKPTAEIAKVEEIDETMKNEAKSVVKRLR